MRLHRTVSGARGYTMMELVIAAMLSMLIIAGLYVVHAGHTRVFRGQEQVAQTQTAIRFAMELIRSDLENAGAMGVSDTNEPEVRTKLYQTPALTPARIMAVQLLNTGSGGIYNPSNVNLATEPNKPSQAPDRLTLVGNYANGEEYWIDDLRGTTVTLQNTVETTDPFPPDENTFNAIFEVPTGGGTPTLARIRTPNKLHFTRVTGRSFANGTVTVSEGMASEEPCDGCQINVMNMVRYSVVPAVYSATENPSGAIWDAGFPAYLENRFDLVRDVMDWSNQANFARREVVAENVVDFQVWFLFDAAPTAGLGPAVPAGPYSFADNAPGNAPCNTASNNIGITPNDILGSAPSCAIRNIHGAIVRLSIRSQREDPRFLLPTGGARRPLMWYEVDENAPGAARVRTLVTQVAMPNLSYGM